MDSIQNVINILEPGVLLASIDLKDAFFLCQYIITIKRSLKLFYQRLS